MFRVEISGIKCDACDFHDDSVHVNNYPEWVNRPCPKCGANLLTEADYRHVKLMCRIQDSLNPDREHVEHGIAFEIKMDGSGVPQSIIRIDPDEAEQHNNPNGPWSAQ